MPAGKRQQCADSSIQSNNLLWTRYLQRFAYRQDIAMFLCLHTPFDLHIHSIVCLISYMHIFALGHIAFASWRSQCAQNFLLYFAGAVKHTKKWYVEKSQCTVLQRSEYHIGMNERHQPLLRSVFFIVIVVVAVDSFFFFLLFIRLPYASNGEVVESRIEFLSQFCGFDHEPAEDPRLGRTQNLM